MKINSTLILLLLIISSLITQGQDPNRDSLFRVWNDNTAPDTSRLNAIFEFSWAGGYLAAKPDSAFYYAQLQYDFAESRGLKKQMGDALYTQGQTFSVKNNYSRALEYFNRELKIREEIADIKGIAECLLSIGSNYDSQGEYSTAMDYYQQSLKILEEISDKTLLASVLRHIAGIYLEQGYYSMVLKYYQSVLKIYEETSDKKEIANMLNHIGLFYHGQGDYDKALEYSLKSVEICEENNFKYYLSYSLNQIGVMYIELEDYPSALEYYERSLTISEENNDQEQIVRTLVDIGVIYHIQNDSSAGMEYYKRALKICEEVPYKKENARILTSIGTIYFIQDSSQKALDYIQKSLKIYEEIHDKWGITRSLINIGRINYYHGSHLKSISMYERALQIAEETGILHMQEEVCEYLYDTYKEMGNGNKALEYHEKMLVLTDSINKYNIEKQLQQMEFARKFEADSLKQLAEDLKVQHAHEAEVRKKNRTRNIAYISGAFILLLAVGLYSRLRNTRQAKASIEKEKDRSDNLLLNILPAEIAVELKEKGEAAARDFDTVSVLFTDFIEFTRMSEKLSATELVAEINYCFKGFDTICDKYGIEKIKTIGDAYMAAGGLPISKDDSAKNTVLSALEMAGFIAERKKERETSGQIPFEMRIGIHTGAVVAGIVGQKKFQYDIWGDTVNTASRMENSGEVGRVNISQSTYELIKKYPTFKFQSRGMVKTKGKGDIEMWFVEKA